MEYDIDKHNTDRITEGPWYNTSIWTKLHWTSFENYIRNEITDRYNLMCSIDSNEKQKTSSIYEIRNVGDNVLPSNLTTY